MVLKMVAFVGKAVAVARSLFAEAPRDSREALWEALGGLEFRKQFLILVYSGRYCVLFLVFGSLVGVLLLLVSYSLLIVTAKTWGASCLLIILGIGNIYRW